MAKRNTKTSAAVRKSKADKSQAQKGGNARTSEYRAEMAEKLNLRLREGAFIGFAAVCLYVFIALSTYHADDPGWSTTGIGHAAARNTAGITGAYLSDIFYTLFGYMAFLFPIMLGYRAWLIFRERHRCDRFDWFLLGLRVLGFCLVMLSATGLSHINVGEQALLPEGAGGVLGIMVGNAALNAFNVTGSRLLLSAMLLFGVTIYTGISWLHLMDATGRYTLAGYRRVAAAIGFQLGALREYRERRQVMRQRQRELEAARPGKKSRRQKQQELRDLKAQREQQRREPVVRGACLPRGSHLDLIGSFTPAMREADDACFDQARVFVDTDEALKKSGELLVAIAHGVMSETDVRGTLTTLCKGVATGRRSATERTVFKAVGTALEDLAAAVLIYDSRRAEAT